MTAKDDPRLLGRHPEFARMSLRPGIGADAMHEVASQLMKFNLDTSQADVPSALRHGHKELPLGRYLTRKLRTMIGKDEKAPQETIEKSQKELQHVREAAFNASQSFAQALADNNAPKVARLKSRMKIFERKKSL